MKKINLILLIIASILFLISIVSYLLLHIDIIRYLIIGSFTWIVYWVAWLLGYSCGSSEEKAKIYQNDVKIEFNPNFEKGIKKYIPRDSKGRFIKRS